MYQIFVKGERVKVAMTDKKTSFYMATVSEYSPRTSKSVLVAATGFKNTDLVEKSMIMPTAIKNPVMFLNKAVEVVITDKTYAGTIAKYSPATEDKATVSVPKLGEFLINKTLIKDRVIPVAPKEYFKDHKNSTPDEHLMASLFQAVTHKEVLEIAMHGIRDEFNMYIDPEYTALIPKDLKKGDKLPCLIAHTDLHPSLTHPTKDNLEYIDGNIFKSATGLGADDRAGIFAIMKLLESHMGKFMILFPDKEEVGLVGSRKFAASKHFKEMDKHASMFVSIDRRREHNGDKTLATYDADDNELNKWVSTLTSRKIVRGSSTDCKALSTASKNNVPCFNLSCGYTAEHSKSETLRFDELQTTILDLKDILNDARVNKTYKYEVKKYNNSYSTYNRPAPSKKTETLPYNFGEYTLDECIEIDNEWFFEQDLQELLDVYNYYTGEDFKPSEKDNYTIPSVAEGDFVRMATNMTVGRTYGGQVFTKDMKLSMEESLWEVNSVNPEGSLELDGLSNINSSCNNIPRRWVDLVTPKSPVALN